MYRNGKLLYVMGISEGRVMEGGKGEKNARKGGDGKKWDRVM